jgi:hypothetical protein
VPARPAADVVSAMAPPHQKLLFCLDRFAFTSAALLLQAASLVLSFCSTYWTEPLCSTHDQLQECQLRFLILTQNTSRSHRSARLSLLLTPGL